MTSKFSVHGKARYTVVGRIVRLHIEGPWNQELVLETHRSLAEVLTQMKERPWGLLILVEKSALCEPAALAAIRRAAATEKDQTGRGATAWVLPRGVEGATIMRGLLDEIYAGINPVRAFEDEVDAERWLLDSLGAQ